VGIPRLVSTRTVAPCADNRRLEAMGTVEA